MLKTVLGGGATTLNLQLLLAFSVLLLDGLLVLACVLCQALGLLLHALPPRQVQLAGPLSPGPQPTQACTRRACARAKFGYSTSWRDHGWLWITVGCY